MLVSQFNREMGTLGKRNALFISLNWLLECGDVGLDCPGSSLFAVLKGMPMDSMVFMARSLSRDLLTCSLSVSASTSMSASVSTSMRVSVIASAVNMVHKACKCHPFTCNWFAGLDVGCPQGSSLWVPLHSLSTPHFPDFPFYSQLLGHCIWFWIAQELM